MGGYAKNVTKEDFFKALHDETPEASWCRTCVKREKCKIKEKVSIEEHMISFARIDHLKVKVECREYINDAKVKDIKNDLLHELGLRGRRL